MPIVYFVLFRGDVWEVFRGSASKSCHSTQAQALRAARSLAALEHRLAGSPTEVHVEDSRGHRRFDQRFGEDTPPPQPDPAAQAPIENERPARVQAAEAM